MAKIPITASFCFNGSRNFQTIGIGKQRIIRSVARFKALPATPRLNSSMQVPGIVIFQYFSLGVHAKMLANMIDMLYEITKASVA